MIIKNVRLIQESKRQTLGQLKSYAGQKRCDLEFNVDDKVFMKIALCQHVMMFDIKWKVTPRYIGPFEVFKRINNVAYWFALLVNMDHIQNVFHVSLLYKHVNDFSHVLRSRDIDLKDNLVYVV